MTFISASTGWALGTSSCGGITCLAMRKTVDDGRVWSPQPLPGSMVATAGHQVDSIEQQGDGTELDVRFASASNGWIYGELDGTGAGSVTAAGKAVLWSTHDGGRRWVRQPLPGLGGSDDQGILDLEASGGVVHFVAAKGDGFVAESSPVGQDRWRQSNTVALRLPPGGTTPEATIILHRSSGWMVLDNDRGVFGSARLQGGRWVAWTPPCSSVGGSPAVPVALTSTNLVTDCQMGGYALGLSPTAPPGATLHSTWLYTSTDAGSTFSAGPEIGTAPSGYGVLAAASTETFFVAAGANADANSVDIGILGSFDGGHTWASVYPTSPYFLAFTTPTQGVALVATPGPTPSSPADVQPPATSMVMTYDDGHTWTDVLGVPS